jgi:hypothetical protein
VLTGFHNFPSFAPKWFTTLLFKIIIVPKKGDSPQRAQRKVMINQENKVLFAALLCALAK